LTVALAWITEVRNATDHAIFLKQTDPTRNPKIDEVVSGAGWQNAGVAIGMATTGVPSYSANGGWPERHTWFAVAPNTVLKTSSFVVPWANTEGFVHLVVNRGGKPIADVDTLERSGVQFQVVPDGGGANDFIQFFDRDLSPLMGSEDTALPAGELARISVGPAGAAASASGRLVVTDSSVTYTITTSNSAGADLIAVTKGVGELVLDVAAVVVAAG
jgi:hypothetical protein